MQARCPHCSAVFESNRSGLQFCPHCGQQIQVPEPGPGERPASPASAPPSGAEPWTPGGYGGSRPPGSFASPSGAPPSGGPAGSPPGPGFGSSSGGGYGSPPGGGYGGPPGGGFGAPPSGPGEPPGGAPIRQPTPWERRKEIGWVKGLVETWRQSVLSPQMFWPSVKPDADWVDGLLFAWLIVVVTAVGSLPLQALQPKRGMEMLGSMKDLPPQAARILEMVGGASHGMGYFFAVAVATLLLFPIVLFIYAAIVHLFCMLFGCAANGYWATFRALAYSAGPHVLGVLAPLPWIGGLFAFVASIYSLVLAVWGVYRLQDTTPGRAAAAVLAPFVLLCCCCGALIALFAGTIGAALKSAGG